MTRSRSCLLALGLTTLGGCTQMGPRTVPVARLDYSEAIVRSSNEQMLLNLVRLRYRDTPVFLEVGSVVTSFSRAHSVGVGAVANVDNFDGTEVGFDAGYSISESPTVTYSPVQGDAFVQRLLGPLSPNNLMVFSQTGWSIERLLLCCVQRLNNLRNAAPAAGPTPDYVPDFQDFHEAARRLRNLQKAGFLDLELSEDGKTPYLTLAVPPGHPATADADRLRELLQIDRGRSSFEVTASLKQRGADEIAISGRSLLSVLFFLSQAVEVPPEHEAAGLVTVTKSGETAFDWREVTGNLLRVRSSAEVPESAAVKVRYRGHWFYLADDDLNSKTTFGLLNYLYALKAASGDIKEPLLTLGIR